MVERHGTNKSQSSSSCWSIISMSKITDAEREFAAEMEKVKELERRQEFCNRCGKPLGAVRWQCPTCGELSCSEECRREHIAYMDFQ